MNKELPGDDGTGPFCNDRLLQGKHHENACIHELSEPVKTFPTQRRITVHSKKNKDLLVLIQIVIAMLAAGQSINEEQTYKLSPSTRYRRGDCMKALKIVARMYSRYTRLVLNNGIWSIEPTFEVSND